MNLVINRFLFLLLALCFCQSTFARSADKPNIIFVLTDDQSYGMMGCTGNRIVQTPNLDNLAYDGILFTNAHITSAICTPSRVSMLLSEFERKHGVNFNSGTSMNLEAWNDSYPMVMRRNGYYTGWVGKNHAPVGEGGYKSGVMEESFDYWYSGHGHLTFYPKDRHKIFEQAKYDTQPEVISEGVSDFLSNEHKLQSSIKFLESRPAEKPFMLTVCFNLPHSAGTGSMQLRDSDDELYRTAYRDLDISMPDNYVAKKDITQPKLPADLLKVENRQSSYDFVDTPENKERIIRQYQSMTGIDRMVGNLRAKLRELKIEKNTIIIFTSDHGLFMGQFGLGGKALCYEITTHVPMIIFDPRMKKSMRGKKSDALVQSIDLAPTMLEMSGIEIPSSYQGTSLVKHLNDPTEKVREYVFTENLWSTQFGNPRCEAVQDQEWKYIRYYQNTNIPALTKIRVAKELGIDQNHMLYSTHDPDIALYRHFVESSLEGEAPVYEELYHLSVDPDETNNLSRKAQYEEVLEHMRVVWKAEITKARGEGAPRVLRYTVDSRAE